MAPCCEGLYHVRIIPKHLPFLALLPPEEWATIVLDEVSVCVRVCVHACVILQGYSMWE